MVCCADGLMKSNYGLDQNYLRTEIWVLNELPVGGKKYLPHTHFVLGRVWVTPIGQISCPSSSLSLSPSP
jgi:hypothetical protein